MIMNTFVAGFYFTGKTVIPFTIHGMSGLGTTIYRGANFYLGLTKNSLKQGL